MITCTVTRAVHLELTQSQNLTDFLFSFSKFCSRFQIPELIVSDNGKIFVGANNHMPQIYGPMTPKWYFIPPRAPWWGVAMSGWSAVSEMDSKNCTNEGFPIVTDYELWYLASGTKLTETGKEIS